MQIMGQYTVVLDGEVSGEGTERVAEALGALCPGGALLIDVSKAGRLDGVWLARLARVLAGRVPPVTVRILGLRRPDLQLLGYLGLDLDATGVVLTGPPRPAASA